MKKGVSLAGLIFWLYLFILSIELLKKSSLELAPNIIYLISITSTPLRSLGLGWILTTILQASGTISILTTTLVSTEIIPVRTALFIGMGSTIGTAITALIISLFSKAKKRRDFRHGFEIAACSAIYAFYFVIFLFLVELFTKIFSKGALSLGNLIQTKTSLAEIPSLIEIITNFIITPLHNNLTPIILLLLGFLALFFSLKYIASSILETLGGEKKAKEFIHKFFDGKYKTFFVGLIITAVVFSSSITIGLLVPLTVSRLINLKKSIPFILGAFVGTSTDVLLASLVTGSGYAISVALFYVFFRLIGAIIFLPNMELLFRSTKYFSKKLLHVSREKAILFTLFFIMIPLILIII